MGARADATAQAPMKVPPGQLPLLPLLFFSASVSTCMPPAALEACAHTGRFVPPVSVGRAGPGTPPLLPSVSAEAPQLLAAPTAVPAPLG